MTVDSGNVTGQKPIKRQERVGQVSERRGVQRCQQFLWTIAVSR